MVSINVGFFKILLYSAFILISLNACFSNKEYIEFSDIYKIPDSVKYVKLIDIPNNIRSFIPVTKKMLLNSESVNTTQTSGISEIKITSIFSELNKCNLIKKLTPDYPLDLRRGLLFLDSNNKIVGSLFIEKVYPFGRRARLLIEDETWSTDNYYGCISKKTWLQAIK